MSAPLATPSHFNHGELLTRATRDSARDEALIYTDSVPNLRETLSRAADKEMALDAIGENSRDKQQERNDLTNDPLAPHLLPRMEQGWTMTQPTLKRHRRKPPSLPLTQKKPSSLPQRC